VRNNAKFFATPENFIRLHIGAVNNVIELGYLVDGVPADADPANNMVYCSFRGEEMEQIAETDLDSAGNEDKFAYVTSGAGKNVIKIAVDKIDIDTSEKARKYITGLWVDYLLDELVYNDLPRTPLYYFKVKLSDGTLVSLSQACTMETIRRKMDALDKDAAINKIGYNEYYIRRAVVRP
jgi:hypothetical protein